MPSTTLIDWLTGISSSSPWFCLGGRDGVLQCYRNAFFPPFFGGGGGGGGFCLNEYKWVCGVERGGGGVVGLWCVFFFFFFGGGGGGGGGGWTFLPVTDKRCCLCKERRCCITVAAQSSVTSVVCRLFFPAQKTNKHSSVHTLHCERIVQRVIQQIPSHFKRNNSE